jgi:hypothetical protein
MKALEVPCANRRHVAVDESRWLFLPRPWMNVDDALITYCEALEIAAQGNEIFVRGQVREADRIIHLPYWHKAVVV